MVRRTTLVAAIGLLAMLALAVPQRASACSCCACDFGHGIIECGVGVDVTEDCGGCIKAGGVPAPDCSVCSKASRCAGQTLCAGDPQMCVVPPLAPAPTLTPWGLLAMALLLVSAGAFTLRRRMRGR